MRTRGKIFTMVAVCLLSVSLPLAVFAASPATRDASGHIGMEAAKEVALNHAGAKTDPVTFTKVKLDYDHGIAEYEIKFTWNGSRYDYEIDAASGEVTGYSHKAVRQPRSGRRAAADPAGFIGIEKAKEIALKHAGVSADQAVFTKTKLDRERRGSHYEIEFFVNKTEHEFEINASNGAIEEYSEEAHY